MGNKDITAIIMQYTQGPRNSIGKNNNYNNKLNYIFILFILIYF